MTIKDSVFGSLVTETVIDASPTRVWDVLTSNIAEWWPEDFYAGGTSGKRNFCIEAEPGGRMFESWDEGGGTLWGTVVCIDPGKTLQVVGNQFPNWGGPVQWYGTWTLSKNDSGTLVEYSETAVGKISDAALREKEQGWRYLLANLKSNVEGTPPPAWGE